MVNRKRSFFESLFENSDFCAALGKLVMSSAKFETSIKWYIDKSGNVECRDKLPLGGLLKLLVDNHELDKTATEHFGFLLNQRNYFIHNLHVNLSGYPEDELELKKFVNRVNGLSEGMLFFSRLLMEVVEKD